MEANNPEMQQLTERLARVERQNRRLMRGGVALVLSCGSVLLMAQKPQKPASQTIEAQAFVLKDAAGGVRAELHMTPSGPALSIYGTEGFGDANLSAGSDGPRLQLRTEGGGIAGIGVSKGGPSVALLGAGTDERPSVLLDAGQQGAALVLYRAQDNKVAARLAMQENGSGLELFGHAGEDSVILQLDNDEPTLALKDLQGFTSAIGSTAIITPTTGEKTQTSAASIHLFDPKGKPLWSAP
jgi:hypothetical protein